MNGRLRRRRARPAADGRRDLRAQPPPRARAARLRGRYSGSSRSRGIPSSSRRASSRSSSRRALRSSHGVVAAACARDGLRARLCHTQHALPAAAPCPCVVTVHDVSFARDPGVMGRKDRMTFRLVVPRAVRRAARVLTVSERTKRDLVELYGVDPERIVVTPNGVDPVFTPGSGAHDYVLSVGAIQPRKNQLAALDAANAVGLPLVVVGPEKDARARRRAPRPRERGSRATSRPSASSSCTAVRPVSSSRAATRASGSRSSRRWRRARRSWPSRSRRCSRLRETPPSSSTRQASPTESARRSRSATGSSRQGSSERARSAGARPPSGRSPCTGRYSGREGLRGRRLARARRRACALAAGTSARRWTRRS